MDTTNVPGNNFDSEEGVQYLLEAGESNFRCALCNTGELRKRYRALKHIFQKHLKGAVEFEGHRMLQCCKGCQEVTHYHCYCCDRIFQRKGRLLKHLNESSGPLNNEASAPLNNNESSGPPNAKYSKVNCNTNSKKATESPGPLNNESSGTPSAKYSKVEEYVNYDTNRKKEVTCEYCSKTMLKKNLRVHIARIHSACQKNSIHSQRFHDGVCIDKDNGIYMVSDNLKGIRYPVHVQKCVVGTEVQKLFCESQNCEYLNIATGMSNMTSFECSHLQSVQFISRTAEIVKLDEISLDQLIARKRLKPESKEPCMQLKYTAESLGHVLVSSWTPSNFDSDRHTFLSVWVGDVHYYAKSGRVYLTYDQIQNKLNCQCSNSSVIGCLHKSVVKWYLFQTMPQLFENTMEDVSRSSETMLQNVVARKMTDYLMEYKTNDLDIPCTLLKEQFSSEIILTPIETECQNCKIPLKNQQLCGNGFIITRFGIKKDVKVWKKICDGCGLDYWHNDTSSGLFNFNNKMFLSLDLLVWLRNAVLEHVALSREIMLIEKRYHVSIEKDLVIKAFFKYISLTNYGSAYKCCLCGYHPVILTFDVIRKCAFKIDCVDQKINKTETVDMVEFWKQVDRACIDDGYNIGVCNKIVPSVDFWAPWIPGITRAGTDVFSTEFLKGSQELDETDYLKCLSEERLEELFNMGDLRTLRDVCVECGINAKQMTKIECISRLKSAVHSVADIDKLFFKVWKASGGTLTATCPHGIVYCFKSLLKAESPRDIGDILLSMKYPPNIVISDIPHMLAAHVNKRSPEFFNPHAGRVYSPTVENIESASVLPKLSFPWLKRRNMKITLGINLKGTTIHPITLVHQRYSLYDRFHEGNTTQPKEVFRRTKYIQEMDGVQTETAEQLNSFLSRCTYFLDSLSPLHHVQMIKCILAMRNDVKNSKILKSLEGSVHKNNFIGEDDCGRIVIKTLETADTNVLPSDTTRIADMNDGIGPVEESSDSDSLRPNVDHIDSSSASSTITEPNRTCWSRCQIAPIFEGNGTSVMTPFNSPFTILYEDLKTLEKSNSIAGQVLDALFVVLSSSLYTKGVKVYILPNSFFSLIESDSSLEAVVPKNCDDVDFIVAASFYNRHWSLVLVDMTKLHILYLDPIKCGYVHKEKVNLDLRVVKNIVWYSVLGNTLDSDLPNVLPGWTVITDHSAFLTSCKDSLPDQEYGNDCGMFVLMYFWYITSGAKFDFSTSDMSRIRNWCYQLLVEKNMYENCGGYISWLLTRMNGNKLGSLVLHDVPFSGILNNINRVVKWLEMNTHLFEVEPRHPPILQYSPDRQLDIVMKLEADGANCDEDVDLDNLNDFISFSFATENDFRYFVDIVDKRKWVVYSKLEV